jgi:FkbM family methyltransferase
VKNANVGFGRTFALDGDYPTDVVLLMAGSNEASAHIEKRNLIVDTDSRSLKEKASLFLMRALAVLFVGGVAAYQIWGGPETLGGDKNSKDILGTGKNLYSQTGEELAIRDFFQDRKGGVFLDIGAAHYRLHSTTFYLEKHLDWTGIAVDALDRYRGEYEKHRPDTKFYSYLVSNVSGQIETFYQPDGNLLIPTVKKDRAEKFSEKNHAEIKLATITINDLLMQSEVEKIDFLSMDIEDAEPAALAGFDIQRYKPDLVCIEAHASIRDELTKYFQENNYEKIERYSVLRGGLNWYFQRNR